MVSSSDFEKAIQSGRPPNVTRLFPNSRALIVSGKYVDQAMAEKGQAIAMAANGRNNLVIRGALQAAQRRPGANSRPTEPPESAWLHMSVGRGARGC